MRPIQVALSSVTNQIIMVDYFNPNLTAQIVITGTATASIQQTLDDPNNPPAIPGTVTWFNITGLNAITASAIAPLSLTAVRALNFVVSAYTSGTVVFTVIQGSGADAIESG